MMIGDDLSLIKEIAVFFHRKIGIFQTKNILTNRNYSIILTDRNSSI